MVIGALHCITDASRFSGQPRRLAKPWIDSLKVGRMSSRSASPGCGGLYIGGIGSVPRCAAHDLINIFIDARLNVMKQSLARTRARLSGRPAFWPGVIYPGLSARRVAVGQGRPALSACAA